MPDLMENYRDYLRLTHARLESSGFNPRMAGVYRVMMEIAAQATDEASYQRLYNERGLVLETYRATALDTYETRLRQAREDNQPDAEIYAEIVESVRVGADQASIAAGINSGMERVAEVQKMQSRRDHGMRALLDNLAEYAYASPLLDVGNYLDGAKRGLAEVREGGGDPDVLFRDPKWRADYRLPEKFWAALESAYEAVKAGRVPDKTAAEKELQEEYEREAKALAAVRAKMPAHYAAHDAEKENKRSTFVAYATPDGYEYECVWMKGGR